MPRRKLHPAEVRLRQAVLSTAGPLAFGVLHQLARRAETRVRRTMAVQRHVRGRGLEIGAAASPSLVPRGCHVTYVDKYPAEVLRKDPELRGLPVRAPDLLASAEHLEGVPRHSQDFVLAFSMIEHAQSPLHMLESAVRVTRPGGVVVLSAPDKRYYAPDRERPLTTFEHLVRDYEEGPAWSYEAHLREAAARDPSRSAEEVEAFVARIRAEDGHTHFHVWDAPSFLETLLAAERYLRLPVELVEFASYGHEALAVWRVRA